MAHPPHDDAKLCTIEVAAMFPNIAPDFLRKVAAQHSYDATATINHIVDEEEAGRPYAKSPQSAKKRKRDEESDDEDSDAEADEAMTQLKHKYDNPRRRAMDVTEAHISLA